MHDVMQDDTKVRRFDVVIDSDRPAPGEENLRWKSFADLIFEAEDASSIILTGDVDGREKAINIGELQNLCAQLAHWTERRGINSGDTVALVRLDGATELPLAAATLAMMALGIRVFLPLGFDAAFLPEMLRRVGARAVLTFADDPPDAPQRRAREKLDEICAKTDVPHHCLRRDVDLFGGQRTDFRPPETNAQRQAVVFSTSGTTGAPKLVPYRERTLLTGAQAWEEAGMLDPELLGGPTVVPLLSHTMGFRQLLHALWTRRRALFIRPEWLEHRPYRVVSLLLKYPPRHATCGPALLNVYVEYMRQFPVLRDQLEPRLRCIVSSGTAFSRQTRQFYADTEFANAFGTTETQQVLNTLLCDDAVPGELGRPLPGVRVAVQISEGGGDVGRLYVSSPFSGAGALDDDGQVQPFGDWHATGDLVRVDGSSLYYVGRVGEGFLNSGLGVKVARQPLEAAYANLLPEVKALMIEAPQRRTDLVAIAFVDGDADCTRLQERLGEAAASRRRQLAADGHDLDVGQVPVGAIGVVPGRPPLRGPGKIDRRKVHAAHANLWQALRDPMGRHRRIVDVPADPPSRKRRYLYPRVGRLLEALRLDVEYLRGSGNVLERVADDGVREVLDMTGGYGANLLGHGRPELLEVATRALSEVPLLDQASGRRRTDEFAEKLALRVGRETDRRWIVVPASTGAEAVDLSLKHAAAYRTHRIEDLHAGMRRRFGASHPELVEEVIADNERKLRARRPVVIALKSGFHGKTIGAMHLLSSPGERRVFSPFLAADTVFLDPGGSDEARRRLREVTERETLLLEELVRDESTGDVRRVDRPFSNLLATVAEPILGEGGIIEVPHDWLAELKVDGISFIVDEIQSGLGRAGSFLASTDPSTGEAAPADCILLGKSLGGGVAKLSALLVRRSHYIEHFDEWRGSTFAEDGFSSAVGCKVLDIIEDDDVPRLASRVSERLLARLDDLQKAHPSVITDVRGRGVMVGVELHFPDDPPSTVLRALADRGLGYLAASYLLHRHDLRILPTTSASDVLRLEPSAYLSDAEIQQVVEALGQLCRALETSNAYELLCHIVDGAKEKIEQNRQIALAGAGTEQVAPKWIERQTPAEGALRVAFVHHSMHPSKEMIADVPLTALFSTEQRLELADMLQVATEFEPLVSFSRNFFGGRIWMAGITVMATPLTMEYLYRTGETDLIVDKLQKAVQLASDLDCEALTLGAFTSIVSDDGTLLNPRGKVHVSSGNTFTAAVALHQIRQAAEELGLELGDGSDISVAVVGALGNIGSAMTEVLAVDELPRARVTLFGRPGSDGRLEKYAHILRQKRRPDELATVGSIDHSTELADVRQADLVVVAVNTAEPILFARHIADDRPVIVADVSEPRAASDEIATARQQTTLLNGGLVRLPDDDDFQLSLGAPPGTLYACAAEALLMALSDEEMELTGDIRAANIRKLYELAGELGFFRRR